MQGRDPLSQIALARLGYAEPSSAMRWAKDVALAPHLGKDPTGPYGLLALLGKTAAPDEALTAAVRILDSEAGNKHLGPVLAGDHGHHARSALAGILGVSKELAEFLLKHPEQWPKEPTWMGAHQARATLLSAVGADPDAEVPVASGHDVDTLDALRISYRSALLGIVAHDVTADKPIDEIAFVGRAMSTLASAALDAALAVARHEVGAGTCRLSVIGLGKAGAGELNYISDVDVMFVAAPDDESTSSGATQADEDAALEHATALATSLTRVCSQPTTEGFLWPIDAGLRPEGKQGALVRTIDSYTEYYNRWAKTWEFQALLKAHPLAGDAALGEAFVELTAPLVWEASHRADFVPEVQAMRRKVEQNLPSKDRDRQIKLGQGGLRDVEFSVQLLQLVHGRVDETLRHRDTLSALEALVAGGYVGRDEGAELSLRYRFLRLLEHREQLHRLKRSHVLPTGDAAVRRIARGVGLRTAEDLEERWRHTRMTVRRLHETMFYRPLLASVTVLSADEVQLSDAAARDRLTALGFRDAKGSLRHLRALTEGMSRRAVIQRNLAPVMMEWLAGSADPDAALLSFRRISDTLKNAHWYLKTLRDTGAVAERLAWLLGAGKYCAAMIEADPKIITWLADDAELHPRDECALRHEARAAARQQDEVLALRTLRRTEITRTLLGDMLELTDLAAVGEALATIDAVTIDAGLTAVKRRLGSERGIDPDAVPMAVVAMGRLGGAEVGYASDADVMFVHEARGIEAKEATAFATAVTSALRKDLGRTLPVPALELDASLRPEGNQGPLSRSVSSYLTYYERWSSPWESQALLRARPLAGQTEIIAPVMERIDALRYPRGGLSSSALRDMRKLKARMESERLPRGVQPRRHLKLGPGGLSDVEWTAQLLQLRHGHRFEGLRTTSTLGALSAAAEAGVLDGDDADILRRAWQFLSVARNAVTLWFGKGGDVLPTTPTDLDGVARLLRYDAGKGQEFESDIMRHLRRSRAVMERVFFE